VLFATSAVISSSGKKGIIMTNPNARGLPKRTPAKRIGLYVCSGFSKKSFAKKKGSGTGSDVCMRYSL
jgi:hypothetical protein